MSEAEFIKKRNTIVDEIIAEYFYDKWIDLTGERNFIDSRPETIKKLHYGVGCLYDVLPQTIEGRETALRELELLLCSLKAEYENFAKR